MSDLQKKKKYRNKKYLAWVATLPCASCGIENDTIVPHHIIGVGQGCMGSKSSDLETAPLCHTCHHAVHSGIIPKINQWQWVAKTLTTAIELEDDFIASFSF